jgi:hypothetical protein
MFLAAAFAQCGWFGWRRPSPVWPPWPVLARRSSKRLAVPARPRTNAACRCCTTPGTPPPWPAPRPRRHGHASTHARTSPSCLSSRPATDRYLRINSCSRDRYGSSVSSDTSRPSNAPASGISQLHRALRTNFADTGSADYPPAAKSARLTPLIYLIQAEPAHEIPDPLNIGLLSRQREMFVPNSRAQLIQKLGRRCWAGYTI